MCIGTMSPIAMPSTTRAATVPSDAAAASNAGEGERVSCIRPLSMRNT